MNLQNSPYPMLFCLVLGAVTIGLALINGFLYVRFKSDAAATAAASPLARTAWGASLVCLLLFPCFAPIGLVMGGVAIAQSAGPQPSLSRRPAWIALANSAWALLSLIATLAFFLGPWAR